MTLDADALEAGGAVDATGLDDFGDGSHREGLERLTRFDEHRGRPDRSRRSHAADAPRRRYWRRGCASRTRTAPIPRSTTKQVEGPVFVIGLPRTGTTALSQLVAADPQIRSLRLWESSSPCPHPSRPPSSTDPRIAETEAGLEMMNEMFPLMATMHHEEATGPTECQDLLGMSFRTVHFDGFGHVPSYLAWVTQSDMDATYRYHRRVLRLLQWHCPPRLWHLKTPVHMFALDSLLAAVPRRQVPVEPPRPGQGARVGLQPDPLHAQLGQRPRRLPGARTGAAGPVVRGDHAGDGLPGSGR